MIRRRSARQTETLAIAETDGGADWQRADAEALEMIAVTKRFGETVALNSCSVACTPGEVHVLLGENGSGKSTAVKVLCGITIPDGGIVQLAGQRVRRFSPSTAHHAGVAAVLQEVIVIENLSVMENLFLGIDGYVRRQVSRKDRRWVAASVLDRFPQIAQVAPDAPVHTLALAQRQLLAIARAILRDPRVLILDEATSSLDASAAATVLAQVRELAAAGRSVLFISHRLDEVVSVADRVTVLRGGAVVSELAGQEISAEALMAAMAAVPVPARELE